MLSILFNLVLIMVIIGSFMMFINMLDNISSYTYVKGIIVSVIVGVTVFISLFLFFLMYNKDKYKKVYKKSLCFMVYYHNNN